MEKGNFREDLYYRLNVVRINIPPLRDRKDDINLLSEYFLQKFSPQKKLIIPFELKNKINTYNWPGNIRELENTIHSSIVTASNGVLAINKLPIQSVTSHEEFSFISFIEKGLSFKNAISLVEKKIIEEALFLNDNNQTKTAEYLKMNRRLLYSKMKELSLENPQKVKHNRSIK
jgi:transcriptional regulator with PAS, ATPase and Fis domain